MIGRSRRRGVVSRPGVAQLVEQWTVKCLCAAIHWSAVQICLPGVCFFFFSKKQKQFTKVVRPRAGPMSYGHITAKPPHPIRTAKLSAVELDQYYGGGPRGNLECCMALFVFIFFTRAGGARGLLCCVRSTRVVFVPSKHKIRVRVPTDARVRGYVVDGSIQPSQG